MRLLYGTVLSTLLLLVLSTNATAQVVKDFTQRTSAHAQPAYVKPGSGGKIYNLRGDFKMAGNTNLTLVNYAEDGDASNNSNDLKYVDIDLDGTTINSSSSFLDITNDACTEIVYAGLYWSGRANTGSRTFSATNSGVATNVANNATNVTLYHNNPNNGYYNVEIIRQSTSCGFLCTRYNPLYRFNFEGTVIEFNYTNNSGVNRVQYRYGTSGTWTSVSGSEATGSSAGGSDRARFTFTTPFVVTVNGRDYKINYLNRESRTNRSESDYRETGYGYAQVNLKVITTTSVTKTLDKRVVRLKKEGGTYQTITANADDIQYPSGSYSDMYAAYADVTQYVRANKGGNYFVADLATSAGSTDNTGYFGGWGLVVVYANPTMKWRDITVFDGYAHVAGSTTTSYQLPISGFQAAQAGAINVDIGVMAGEGDRSISGDYFQVLRSGGTASNNNHYINLGNSGGTGGFFYSNIDTGSTRNPNLVNNTGIDIQRISLPNQTPSSNYIIGNGQTSTTFKYGSTQDTYIIYNLVFAVDAYVPETEVLGQITPTAGVDINDLQPNDEVTLTADIFNYGTDAINNGNLQITIPAGMQLVSTSVHTNTQTASGATASYSFNTPTWINPTGGSNAIPAATLGGILEWKLGNVPTQNLVNGNKVPLATLTYKLKVTDNCVILQASNGNCILSAEVEGKITGKGVNSGANFEQVLITGYNTDCNNTPIYGGLNMEINPLPTFLNSCSANNPNPVVNEVRMFKRFCSVPDNVIPRAEITGVYPAGTKFYTDAGVEVIGDFAVDSGGAVINYRAVLSGAPVSCYLKLATQLDVITTQPTTTNVTVCQGESIVLNNQPSNAAYQLFYFQNQTDTTPMTGEPAPTTADMHTYWVAEGTSNGSATCFGTKKSFTITVKAVPTAATLANVELCTFADYVSTINANGATATWEYYNGTAWVVVNTQLVGVAIVANQLKITKAPATLNGTKFRVKLTNTNNCSSVSNEMTLTVKGCQMPVNPMIYTPLKR